MNLGCLKIADHLNPYLCAGHNLVPKGQLRVGELPNNNGPCDRSACCALRFLLHVLLLDVNLTDEEAYSTSIAIAA